MRSRLDTARLHLLANLAGDRFADLEEIVGDSLAAGTAVVQYRSKSATPGQMVEHVRRLVLLCRRFDAIMIVNDRLDVALAAGADGVHLGESDLPWADARRIAPRPFVLGCTAATSDAVRVASRSGADYVGSGPAYASLTKPDGRPALDRGAFASLANVCSDREGSSLPLVAIGGIGVGRAGPVIRAGATAVAVSHAILSARDPGKVTRALIDEVNNARRAAPGGRGRIPRADGPGATARGGDG